MAPIYHIALASQWTAAKAAGEYRVSTLGRTLDDEGFIHCSYAGQVAGVADRFYTAVTAPLVLLTIDSALLGSAVVAEPAVPGSAAGTAGAELFPHVYGPIAPAAVTAMTDLSRDADGRIVLPAL